MLKYLSMTGHLICSSLSHHLEIITRRGVGTGTHGNMAKCYVNWYLLMKSTWK